MTNFIFYVIILKTGGVKVSRFLIIPDLTDIEKSLSIAQKYGFGFEYNDFFIPDILDDGEKTEQLINGYKSHSLPDYCTLHGAFFDVILFSSDSRIREIAELRIRQSLDIARKIGAKGVIFHTNHSPQLTSESYINCWHNKNKEFWSRILPEYSDINIYLENMFDSSPDMLYSLASELSSFPNFGVCFDYAHAEVFGGGAGKWAEKLAPYVKHLHINDNDLEDDLHLAVGDGKIDWSEFKAHYDKYFGECTVLIEVSGSEKQQRSAEFLKKLGII